MTPQLTHALGAAIISVIAASLPAGAFAHGDDDHAQHASQGSSQAKDTTFGRAGDPKKVVRTIKIDMADSMRFAPMEATIQRGQTVRFIVHNSGQVMHEMVLGTAETIGQHAEMMKKSPQMAHAEPGMAHVKPGATGEIVWQFTQAGEFQFACLQPGHVEAGMVGRVSVK